MTTLPSYVEIACDESGFSGTNLLDPDSPVITHASVDLASAQAAEVVAALRSRARRSSEYKANHLLRSRHRQVLEWTLGPDGPLSGRAYVHLVDKAYLVVGTLARVLLEPAHPDPALVLYRDGPAAFGSRQWHDLLAVANNLLRMKNDGEPWFFRRRRSS